MPNDLAALLHSAAEDTAVFTTLVERSKGMVFRWALGLVADADEAEDVTQEVFVLVYRKMSSFRGEGSIEGWMYRITSRVAERRRRNTKRRLALGLLTEATRTSEVYLTDPGGRIDRERALSIIRSSVTLLPPRQREVFDLCDLQGYSPTEAGLLLGVQAVSVRASLFKARAAVRRQILMLHPNYPEKLDDVR